MSQDTSHYDFAAIEAKWQDKWLQDKTFKVSEDKTKEKYYLLEMFPYPSGRIHMGHVRNYTIGDVVARFKRKQGYNVLHPMGWDAFGLPAENAAIKNGIHPAKWTYENMDYMRTQLSQMGLSYDWDREIATCNPKYYKWEQQFFIECYEKDLIYQKITVVNWCETCQTVLAREQVIDGCCWRCDQGVEPRKMNGWFFKITDYAEELLAECDHLDGWPEKVLTMQRNWIGKSVGADIDFKVEGRDDVLTIFTTRPDTIYGATFMSIAPEHPLVAELTKGTSREAEVADFVKKTIIAKQRQKAGDELDKEGVFTGGYGINPYTGDRVPIYAANFVLMEYGTGAVMAVPAHDQRDFEFAKKYNIDIKVVVQPAKEPLEASSMEEAYTDPGVLVNSGEFSDLKSAKAKKAITHKGEQEGFGRRQTTYRLRDWGISRQRYWGTPIPMIHCQECGVQPAPLESLPITLPMDVTIDKSGQSPLHTLESYYATSCPKCGGAARRETDTLDTFVESSWYFARYTCPTNTETPLDREAVDYWLPVDQYIGGVEHAILHLLYSRFFTKILRDLGYLTVGEPFKNLLTQGMVIKDGFKMSKSKGNVVDPAILIEKYGADTVRLFSLFAAPPERDLEWSDQGVDGAYRFLNKVHRFIMKHLDIIKDKNLNIPEVLSGSSKDLHRKTHQTIAKVTADIDDKFHFNTAIAAVMELNNTLASLTSPESQEYPEPGVIQEAALAIIQLLSPMVPHFSEELWQLVGNEGTLTHSPWPVFDEEATRVDEITLVIQVNGKVRSRLQVLPTISEDEIKQMASEDERVLKFTAGKQIRKIIVIKNKLVNIVAN
ncbi:MAG: leucine--tRNA ligase [Desulfobulbaceae bacterium]|jgi:leucyl-tRNA synthetase|nr:leucine--tRNA ligase [Desulfobulbaceae bacterium]